MKQSPSDKQSLSATQEIPHLSRNEQIHYPCSQEPATSPYPGLDASSPQLPTLFP
jgi:hypothetical protein